MAIFEEAEAELTSKFTEIDARIDALEGAAPVDVSALQSAVTTLQAEVVELDARLDAIAAGAADPLS